MDDADYLRKLRAVKDARDRAAHLDEKLSTERTRWNTENKGLLDEAAEADDAKTEAEAQLRDLVLADHSANGRTKYGLGVQVKVFETISYDPAKVLFWAHENFKAAVKTSLDKPVFDAFAKHHPLPGLVEIVKTPKAMLPTKIDLPDDDDLPHLKTIDLALKAPPALADDRKSEVPLGPPDPNPKEAP